MTDPEYGMQLINDDNLLEELIEEFSVTQSQKIFQFVSDSHGLVQPQLTIMEIFWRKW